MKKRILSFLMAIGMLFTVTAFGSCGGSGDSSSSSNAQIESVDYAGQVKLDMNSETKKQEVTVINHIDGDTTHFKVPTTITETGVLKARYLAVNTPESTGQIEEWGKKASNFTKTRIKSAKSIIIETDGTDWAVDSTGERYLVWVWYKTDEMPDYRCLNLELLQEGLAVGSKALNTRYGQTAIKAIDQATLLKLNVHSDEKDPDYFYGDAQPIALKELRLNTEKWLNKRVAFEGVVTQYSNQSVFIQEYDEETGLYYGVQVYYGYALNAFGKKILSVGNRVRVAGNFEYSELVQMYQVCDVIYDPYDSESADNLKLLEKEQEIVYTELSPQAYTSKKMVSVTELNEADEEITVEKTFDRTELIMHTAVSMNNLKVTDAYTTKQGTNEGAITLTCQADGETITVRTVVFKDAQGNEIKQDYFLNKTIDVKGIVDSYNGEAQIKIFLLDNIIIHD